MWRCRDSWWRSMDRKSWGSVCFVRAAPWPSPRSGFLASRELCHFLAYQFTTLVNWPSRAAGCGGMLSNCHVLTVREQMLWMLLDRVHWYPSASSKPKGWSLCLWIYSVTSFEIKSLLVPALHPTWLFTFQLSYYSYFHTARKNGRLKMKLSVASLISHITVCKITRYLKWCKRIYIILLYPKWICVCVYWVSFAFLLRLWKKKRLKFLASPLYQVKAMDSCRVACEVWWYFVHYSLKVLGDFDDFAEAAVWTPVICICSLQFAAAGAALALFKYNAECL